VGRETGSRFRAVSCGKSSTENSRGAGPRRRRRALHRTYAEQLEKRSAGRANHVLPDLVHHFAQCGEADKVVEHASRLARGSLDAFAAETAARAARAALVFLGEDDPEREGALRQMLAAACVMLGRVEEALDELGKAAVVYERVSDRAKAADVLTRAAEVAWGGRKVNRARRFVERGLEAARASGNRASLLKLLALGATDASLRGEHDRARAYTDEVESARAPLEPEEARPPSTAPITRGGIIRVPMPVGVELRTLDPSVASSEVQLEAISTVFETLTRKVEGSRVIPWLASEIRREEDGRRFLFRLREGVRFHDGRPLTADDVRWSFTRLLHNTEGNFRWNLAPIRGARALLDGERRDLEGLKVLSPEEFAIELDEPISFFPTLLTDVALAVVPEGTDDFAGGWRDGTSGTGPFRVTRFEPGSTLELEANPDYWRRGYPRSEGLVFSFGLGSTDIVAGFRSGRYSLAWGLAPADWEALRRDAEFASGYTQVPELSTHFIVFNARAGPLADEDLRRRLVTAIDVRRTVRRGLDRHAVPAHGLIPPGLLGYESTVSPAPRDDEAWSRGAVELTCAMFPVYEHGNLSALRDEILRAMSVAGARARVVSRSEERPDVFLGGWDADYPDPDSFANGVLHSERGYFGSYCGSPELDRLIERGRVEPRPYARHEIYRKIEDVVRERALLLPLLHRQASRFARPEVEGVEFNVSSPYVSYEKLWVAHATARYRERD
jgi:oligopeptide transport system substrate-binding protein